MRSHDLYRVLVPDAPDHRRTESDSRPDVHVLRAVAGTDVRARASTSALDSPRLVSSWSGRIESLLLAIPAYGLDDERLAAGYRSVIAALRRGTRFVVVHPESRRGDLEPWFRSAGHGADAVTYVPLPDYVSFTDWAEDGYVAVTDAADGSTYLIEPWAFPRAGDALIADAVEQHAPIHAVQAPLVFQGGNCLIGSDFWLMGKDYFVDTVTLVRGRRPPVALPDDVPTEAAVHSLFRDYLDAERELRLVGTREPIPIRPYRGRREESGYFLDIAGGGAGTYQPVFHIDMFVTLVGEVDGEFTILVGDPSLGNELLGTESPYALTDVYDEVAAGLSANGARVLRNPLVHQPTPAQAMRLSELSAIATAARDEDLLAAVRELEAAGAVPDTQVTVRDWHHITWNNCLVENTSSGDGPHVYLPTFGHGEHAALSVVDDHMVDMWTGLGFTVHRLADFNEFARRQGVVHCIKKYLERS